ncbi:MAG: ester cyclase [Chloroflexi bacterium]|nr:ester cyclase [Chloroflexota bacterium]
MSLETNKTIVRKYQEAYNTNNLDALDDVVAADIQTPAMLPGFPPGLEGLKQLHRLTVDAWPDQKVTIEDLIAEGDRVAARVTVSATPAKDAFGVPANGKSFRISGQYIVRIQNGKIVEHFGVEDAIGIMQQMGAMPA